MTNEEINHAASVPTEFSATVPPVPFGRSSGSLPDDVSLTNWRASPHNREAFHHVDGLMPTGPVRRGVQTSALTQSVRILDGFALRLPSGTALDLGAFLSATSTDALVVLMEGEVVHEFYGNGMTASSLHILMSATKSVMGLLTEVLSADGRLDTAAPVTNYVPEVGNGPYAGATLRDLLDMRTGVLLDEAAQLAYDEATGWQLTRSGEPSPGLHAFFAGLRGTAAPHGGAFRYVSANTDLLGWCIERATGQSVPALLSALLWAPLQAEQDASITLDPQGAPRCTGGFCATARDFARLGQLLVDKGRSGDVEVIPAALIEDLQRNGDRFAWNRGEWATAFAPISKSISYRSGWYMMDGPPPTLFAMGIYGQNLFVDSTNRIVVAKFSSWSEATDYRALGLTHMALGEIRRCLVDARSERR